MYVQNPQLSQQIKNKLSDRIQDLNWMKDQIDIEENEEIPDIKDEKLVKGRSEGCWYGSGGESMSIKQSYLRFIRSSKEQQEINDKVSQQTLNELIEAMDNLEESDEKPEKFGCASVDKLSSLGKQTKVAFELKVEQLNSMLEEIKEFDIAKTLNKMEKSSMLELVKNLHYELKKTKSNNEDEKELKAEMHDILQDLKKSGGDLGAVSLLRRAYVVRILKFMLRTKMNRIVYNKFITRLRDHIKKSMESFVIQNDELAMMIGKENFYELERLSNDISVEKMELESNIVHFNEQLKFISFNESQNFFTSNFKLPKGSFRTMRAFKKLFVDHWFECKFNDTFSKSDEGLDLVNEFTKDYLHNCLKALRCLKRDLKEQNKTLGQFKHISIETQENTIIRDYIRKICFASSDSSDVDDCGSESQSQEVDLLNYGEMSEMLVVNKTNDKVKKLFEMGDDDEDWRDDEDEEEEAEDKKEEEAEDKKEEAEVQNEAEDKKEAAEGEDESELLSIFHDESK